MIYSALHMEDKSHRATPIPVRRVQRMMGHRHITTTERYLHYAPDPDAAAKLTALWGGSDSEEEINVVPLRRAA